MRSQLRSDLSRLLWLPNPWIGSVESTTSENIVLTFDDGPDPVQTPLVLRSLEAHGASATFFVLMSRTRRRPELVREIVAEGHEVGLHGPDHVDLTEFSYREALTRTADAKSELEEITGKPVRWFRPPYGRLGPSSLLAVHRAGLSVALWSASAWDWLPSSPTERWEVVLGAARPGAIFLAHDGIADCRDGVDDGPVAFTDRAAWIDEVLDEFDRRGLVGRSLGKALESGKKRKILRMSIPFRGQTKQASTA